MFNVHSSTFQIVSKRIACTALAITLTVGTTPTVFAQSDSVSRAASSSVALSGVALSTVVAGAALSVYAGGSLIVQNVQWVGESATLVLRSVSTAGELVLSVKRAAIEGASLAVGSALHVVALATGTALVAGSVVVAFVPAVASAALFHSARSR